MIPRPLKSTFQGFAIIQGYVIGTVCHVQEGRAGTMVQNKACYV